MARPRTEEYPEHPPGTVPCILMALLERSGRSMRDASLAAGLGPDAIRGIRRNPDAKPRPATLAKLAAALGVDVGVLTGELPIPDVVVTPKPAPASAPKTAPVAEQKAVLPHADVRHALRDAVRAAMKKALADGMLVHGVLADVVLSAMLFAVKNGLDDVEAARIVGGIGVEERSV